MLCLRRDGCRSPSAPDPSCSSRARSAEIGGVQANRRATQRPSEAISPANIFHPPQRSLSWSVPMPKGQASKCREVRPPRGFDLVLGLGWRRLSHQGAARKPFSDSQLGSLRKGLKRRWVQQRCLGRRLNGRKGPVRSRGFAHRGRSFRRWGWSAVAGKSSKIGTAPR